MGAKPTGVMDDLGGEDVSAHASLSD